MCEPAAVESVTEQSAGCARIVCRDKRAVTPCKGLAGSALYLHRFALLEQTSVSPHDMFQRLLLVVQKCAT